MSDVVRFSWARPTYTHGTLRGADALHGSPQFEGRFGRMFRTLPAAKFDPDELRRLALEGMTADPDLVRDAKGKALRDEDGHLIPRATSENEVDDRENFGIPAGYTYLGQFIDHDITFDPASSLQKQNDPESLVDYRTAKLDLDSLYGRGPADQPYMYEQDGLTFAFGRSLSYGARPSPARDLPRFQGRALIGDKRNDENVIISQLHGVFMKFHNKVARWLGGQARGSTFEDIQRIVRWHYQWIVLHDFLPRIVHRSTINAVLPHLKKPNGNIYIDEPKCKFYKWKNEPFMPIEFAAAAYRFGHSMVRPIYRLNTELGRGASADEIRRGIAGRLFVFWPVLSEGLNGFREFPAQWAIDWSLFFETEKHLDPSNRGPHRVQPSYKIQPSLASPLGFLPEFSVELAPGKRLRTDADGHPLQRKNEISNLAYRNLLRGDRMGLPSGQTVARFMGLKPIEDGDLTVGTASVAGGKNSESILHYGRSFQDNAPLWFYVLAEAQHDWRRRAEQRGGSALKKNTTPVKLGPVGGRIVAEVLIGLLLGDSSSFLSQQPAWKPDFMLNGKFGMPELIKFAGL